MIREFNERTLWAMAGTLLPDSPRNPRVINRAGLFLLRQCGRMPDLIRMPMRIATLIFGLSGILFYGKPFFCLKIEQRRNVVARWRNSSVGPLRDYVRLIGSLVLIAAYEVRD